MTRDYSMKELVDAVKKTEKVDESGDASFARYFEEVLSTRVQDDHAYQGWSMKAIFVEYLIWANGPNWEEFLKTANTGDIP